MRLSQASESLAAEQLHGEHHELSMLKRRIRAHHVGVLHLHREARLEAAAHIFVGLRHRQDHLERGAPSRMRWGPLVDGAHASVAKLALDAVVAEGLTRFEGVASGGHGAPRSRDRTQPIALQITGDTLCR